MHYMGVGQEDGEFGASLYYIVRPFCGGGGGEKVKIKIIKRMASLSNILVLKVQRNPISRLTKGLHV